MEVYPQQLPFEVWAPLAWFWGLLWYCLSRRALRRLGRKREDGPA